MTPPFRVAAQEKRARFVDAYLSTLDGVQSARAAGYVGSHLDRRALLLLQHKWVSAEIARRRAIQIAQANLSAVRVLEELRRLAFVDARDFFREDGTLKPLAELTPEQGACVASFEIVVKNAAAGDGMQDIVHKLKFWDKTRALNDLARHFALLVDKVQVSAGDGLAAAIAEGRIRAAARNRKARE